MTFRRAIFALTPWVAAALLFIAAQISPFFVQTEHQLADWRMALLSTKADTQRDDILIISITESDLLGYPSRSPVDRTLLKTVIERTLSLEPRAIGIDIIFDQPTEPETDAHLTDLFASAALPIIVAVDNVPHPDPKVKRSRDAFQTQFLTQAKLETGIANLNTDEDGVVRDWPYPHNSDLHENLFSSKLATIAGRSPLGPKGSHFWESPERGISWQLDPNKNTRLFASLSAASFLDLGNSAKQLIQGRLVIIGTDFQGSDTHETALSLKNDAKDGMNGTLLQAQLVAGALDNRYIHRPAVWLELMLYIVAGYFGIFIGRLNLSSRQKSILALSLGGVILLLDCLIFRYLSIELPTGGIILVYGLCHFLSLLRKRKTKPLT